MTRVLDILLAVRKVSSCNVYSNWTFQGDVFDGMNTAGIAKRTNTLVAVGGLNGQKANDNNNIRYSSNGGATWNAVTNYGAGTSDAVYRGVATDGSVFVAVNENQEALRSVNGINWIKGSGPSRKLFSVIWNGTIWLSTADSGKVYTSSDGLNWTEQTVSDFGDDIYSVAWNGTRFMVAGKSGKTSTSTDGITWTNSVTAGSQDLNTVAWAGAPISAWFVGAVDSGDSTIFRSTDDGATWPVGGQSGDLNFSANQIVSVNSIVYALGTNGTVYTSDTGNSGSWTSRPELSSTAWNNATVNGAFYDGTLYAVGQSGLFARSACSSSNVSVVAEISGNTYAAATNPFTVTTPASTQVGDVVYIFATTSTARNYSNTTTSVGGPDVGTLIFNQTDGAVNNTRLICVKVTSAAAGATTYRVNLSAGATGDIKAIVVRGASGETSTSQVNPVSFNIPAPSTTVGDANRIVLFAYCNNSVNNADSITLPGTLDPVGTSLNSGAGAGNARLLHVGYMINPALGATGIITATYASTTAKNSVSGTVQIN